MLHGIPVWAVLLLFFLIVQGVRARRERDVGLAVALATPVVFITWGLATLFIRPGPAALLGAVWIVAALIGGLVGLRLTPGSIVSVDVTRRTVRPRGSPVPLIRNLLIFGLKFALTVAMTIHPEAVERLSILDIGISGLTAGYFAAWLGIIGNAWRGGPRGGPSLSMTPRPPQAFRQE